MADKFDMTMPHLSPVCRRMQDMLSDYIDGVLEEDKKAELESHLMSCSVCMQEYKAMYRLTQFLHAMPKPAIPKELDSRLKRTIHEQAVVMAAAPVVDHESAARVAEAITPVAETAPEEQKEASKTVPVYAPKSNTEEGSDDDYINLPIYEKNVGKRRKEARKEIERQRGRGFGWKRLASVAAVFVIGIFTIVLYNNSSDIFNTADEEVLMQDTQKVHLSTKKTSDAGILDDAEEGLDASQYKSTLNEEESGKDEESSNDKQVILNSNSENDSGKGKPNREETMKAMMVSPEPDENSVEGQNAAGIENSYSKEYYLSDLGGQLSGNEYSIVMYHQRSDGAWVFEVDVCTGTDAQGEKVWNTRVYTGWDGTLTWRNK